MANRKAPMHRLIHKLGLMRFTNVGPLRPELLPAASVGIGLKQHVGAPCQPVVAVGDRVRKGQAVGRPPVTNGKPALGAPVHASIDGTVREVTPTAWCGSRSRVRTSICHVHGETPSHRRPWSFSSIGVGYLAQDEMLKAATVDLLIARTICSGKYLVIVSGSVSDVEAAVQSRA